MHKYILLATLCLIICEPAKAAIVCDPNGGYMAARQAGKDAYSELSNADLYLILIDNDPALEALGACMEALNLADKLGGLLSPSIYVNVFSMQAIMEFIKQQVIRKICTEILDEAQEAYGIISDVITAGEYVIEVEGVGSGGIGI